MEKDIWTIEINLDDDFANACAYHIDYFKNASANTIRNWIEKSKTGRWAIVGLASSVSEAREKCEKLRQALCEMHKRKPYGIEELIENTGNNQDEIVNQNPSLR